MQIVSTYAKHYILCEPACMIEDLMEFERKLLIKKRCREKKTDKMKKLVIS